jgi:hypothetical protein
MVKTSFGVATSSRRSDYVLGHVILKDLPEAFVDGYFNDSASGKQGKTVVQHKDVDSMSILK